MLTQPLSRKSDPRVLYGILAQEALNRLAHSEAPKDAWETYYASLLQLLDMYCYDSFEESQSSGVLAPQRSLLETLDNDTQELRQIALAMESAHHQAFPKETREQVVLLLRNVLKIVYSSQSQEELSLESVTSARKFFQEFLRKIS
ncbi:MAG TPA: hypothetical protein VGH91_01815 [Gammaproteobacteria bacterium]|jgi:hypothetical protein